MTGQGPKARRLTRAVLALRDGVILPSRCGDCGERLDREHPVGGTHLAGCGRAAHLICAMLAARPERRRAA